MSVINKIMWTAGMLFAIALILMTGQINKRNFQKIQNSIEGIYKDRLVVKGLIFDLSTSLYQKEMALVKKDNEFFAKENNEINEAVMQHITDFKATKLTPNEDATLRKFEDGVNKLIYQEEKAKLASESITSKDIETFTALIIDLHKMLGTLSEIQLEEGRRKLNISGGAVDSMNFFEKIENYFLIIFAVLILVVIFAVPGEKKKGEQEQDLDQAS
jgi:uncharacterized membrane protein